MSAISPVNDAQADVLTSDQMLYECEDEIDVMYASCVTRSEKIPACLAHVPAGVDRIPFTRRRLRQTRHQSHS